MTRSGNRKTILNATNSIVTRTLAALLLFALTPVSFSQLIREPNTTLRLPAEPISANGDIILAEAFPGVRFDAPVCLRSLPGETNRLFIVERKGRIMVITNLANPEPEVFLDIRERVFASDWITDRRTEGLSSVAFHPRFNENGRFFVTYNTVKTNSLGEFEHYNVLAEFQASEDRLSGLPDSEIRYITQFDEGEGHNINDAHFGPDNYLYVAIGDEGDGGTGGDEYNNAQKIDKDFFSAIMRIDVDKRPGNLPPNAHPANSTNYWIPADNPFVGSTTFLGKPLDTARVHTEFWAVGFRNAWRISFDPLTGALYEGDVGQHWREEINRIVKGGNYGWSFKEGKDKGPKSPAPAGFSFIDPIYQYGTGRGALEGYSVTGGVVYRGLRIPSLYGHYIFGDYVSGNIWAMNIDQNPPAAPRRIASLEGIASFGYDPRNGDVLLVYHNEKEPGKIYKFEVSGGTTESYPETLADTGIFSDLGTLAPNPGIIPFEVNLPFWSDGAIKTRWFSLPTLTNQMIFSSDRNWTFPPGAIWIKHFELELTPGDARTARRVETRVLVKSTAGTGIYGLTYKWDDDGINAVLVPELGDTKTYVIDEKAGPREQTWRFPGRTECLACHTTVGGLVLGFNTAQLNKVRDYGTFKTNQIGALAAAGYLLNPPGHLNGLRALAASDDESISRTYRVRSYLDANCAFCHQPGGSALAAWDARAITPLSFANIVNGDLNNTLGDLSNRVVLAASLSHSALFQRIASETNRMPPIGSSVLDQQAIDLLSAWITNDLPKYEIYSTWAARRFADLPHLDATPEADADNDGRPNYEEFLAGTNPLSSASKYTNDFRIVEGKVWIGAAQPPGRALLIEMARRLSNPTWELLDSPANSLSFPLQPQTRSMLDVMDEPSKFYRVRLLEP